MVSGLHLQEICFCDVCFNFGTKLDRNDTGYVSWACRCVAADHVCKGCCETFPDDRGIIVNKDVLIDLV